VLGLVGLGLTNPEIADRLYISRKTAAHHVSNVLAKARTAEPAEAVAQVCARGKEGIPLRRS
jgi:DNA-binding NarL/FixJ family response regulator